MGVLEKLVNCILEVHERILHKTLQETACRLVIVIYTIQVTYRSYIKALIHRLSKGMLEWLVNCIFKKILKETS